MSISKTANKRKSHKMTKILVFSAICIAMSVILSKYLSLNLGNSLRIGFGELPIIFAGIFLGPFFGAVVGMISDLLGCLLVGFAINPIITCGVMLTGALSGILYRYAFKKFKPTLRLVLSVYPSSIIGSLLVTTFGLWLWFAKDTNFFVYLLSSGRILSYLINYTITVIVLRLILPSICKAFPPFVLERKKETKN